MRDKCRLSIMIVLIIMFFLYIIGVVGVGEETKFAFALAALILSLSNVFENFAGQNKIAKKISFISEILALSVICLYVEHLIL